MKTHGGASPLQEMKGPLGDEEVQASWTGHFIKGSWTFMKVTDQSHRGVAAAFYVCCLFAAHASMPW